MSVNMIAGYHELYWAEPAAAGGTTVYLGATGPNGIQLIETPHIDFITGDVLGPLTEVDGVYQGQSMILQFMVQEVKLAVCKKFLRPFVTTVALPEVSGEFGVPGSLLSSYFGTLEAVPRTLTPAASYQTVASTKQARRFVGLHVGEVVEALDTNKRFIPVTFRAFPFVDAADGNKVKMFKWITGANGT